MTEGIAGFREILGDLSLRTFLDDHLHRVPYTSRGGAVSMADRLTWSVVEGLVGADGADVLTARAGALGEEPPADAEDARRLHAEGWTVAVRHAERHDAGLQELAQGFEQDFGAAVDVHVYATPAEREASPGTTTSRMSSSSSRRGGSGSGCVATRSSLARPRDDESRPPVRAGDLAGPRVRSFRGDWVYVPPGWWHQGQALEDSLSLAIGVMTPTALDLLDALRRELASSVVWRQRLPVLGELAGDEEGARWEEILRALGPDVAHSIMDPRLRAAIRRSPDPSAD